MLEWYERITGGGSDSRVDLWNNDRGIRCYEDRRNIQACTAAKARSGAYQYARRQRSEFVSCSSRRL